MAKVCTGREIKVAIPQSVINKILQPDTADDSGQNKKDFKRARHKKRP